MKKIILLLFSALTLSLFASAQSKDETAVADAVTALRKAMLDADSTALVQLVRKELSYGHSSGKLEDKNTFVSALASGRSDFRSIELADQTITVANNTALVRHTLTGQVVDNGKQSDVKLMVLLVWVKEKGKWQLLARQAIRPPQ